MPSTPLYTSAEKKIIAENASKELLDLEIAKAKLTNYLYCSMTKFMDFTKGLLNIKKFPSFANEKQQAYLQDFLLDDLALLKKDDKTDKIEIKKRVLSKLQILCRCDAYQLLNIVLKSINLHAYFSKEELFSLVIDCSQYFRARPLELLIASGIEVDDYFLNRDSLWTPLANLLWKFSVLDEKFELCLIDPSQSEAYKKIKIDEARDVIQLLKKHGADFSKPIIEKDVTDFATGLKELEKSGRKLHELAKRWLENNAMLKYIENIFEINPNTNEKRMGMSPK